MGLRAARGALDAGACAFNHDSSRQHGQGAGAHREREAGHDVAADLHISGKRVPRIRVVNVHGFPFHVHDPYRPHTEGHVDIDLGSHFRAALTGREDLNRNIRRA